MTGKVAVDDVYPGRAAGSDGGGLCDGDLRLQNVAYAGTGGVSRNNCGAGFIPAYHNTVSGETVVSRFANGSPAPVHVLDGLPSDWVQARDASGNVSRTLAEVVAGFVRDGVFYTREAAAQVVAEGGYVADS